MPMVSECMSLSLETISNGVQIMTFSPYVTQTQYKQYQSCHVVVVVVVFT